MLAQITNRTAPRFALPQPAITLLGAVGETIGSERICRETSAHARRRQWFDFSKAAKELGWRARTPLEEMVGEAVRWFKGAAASNSGRLLVESNVAYS